MSKVISYTSASLPGINVLSCTGDHHFKNHIHNGYVIWLNSESGEHFSLTGNSTILQPGSIGIIEPGIVHSNWGFEGENRHLRSFYIEKSFFSHIEKLITGEQTGKFKLPTMVLEHQKYWQQFVALHDMILGNRDQMVQEQTAIELFQNVWEETLGGENTQTDINDPSSLLIPLIEFMHANLTEPIELTDLAQLVQRTEFHIIRLFKKHVGMSPHAYLIQLRLEKARILLEKNGSIVDAAIQAGFSDQSHLTRKFKIRYGITPGVYLNSIT